MICLYFPPQRLFLCAIVLSSKGFFVKLEKEYSYRKMHRSLKVLFIQFDLENVTTHKRTNPYNNVKPSHFDIIIRVRSYLLFGLIVFYISLINIHHRVCTFQGIVQRNILFGIKNSITNGHTVYLKHFPLALLVF